MKKVFILSTLFITTFLFLANSVEAYGECTKYGSMAVFNSYSGTCSCMAGYVFSDDLFGTAYCVDADMVCHDKYGYNSKYNYSGKSCECSYGYVWGKDSIGRTSCVSPADICKDQLGYSSRYNSLSDKCECDYGYFIHDGQCVHGTNQCRLTHGLYASYNDSANRCECDSGYTLDDDNQCVKKQNNVYFTLKELDTDNKKAIIKSDYDYKYYLITYNYGCYASSFSRYLNHQIVVNLGTDLYLDTWDKIVLQDDDETCDITHKEYADSSTTLEPEVEQTIYVPRPVVYSYPAPTIKKSEISKQKDFIVNDSEIKVMNSLGTIKDPATFRKCPSTECSVIRYYAETSEVSVTGSTLSGDWYRVEGTTDAEGSGQLATGWIYASLFEKVIPQDATTTTQTETKNEKHGWFWRFINWASN